VSQITKNTITKIGLVFFGLSFILLTGVKGLTAQVSVDAYLKNFELQIENKIKKTLDSYLSKETKSLVLVHVVPGNEPKTVKRTPAVVDFGYVPIPIYSEDLESIHQAPVVAKAPLLWIKSVDAEVRVDDSVPDKTMALVNDIVASMLKGLNANVQIRRVSFPVEPTISSSFFSWERFIEIFKTIVPFLSALVVALMLVYAFVQASNAVKYSSSEIAGGMRNFKISYEKQEPPKKEETKDDIAEVAPRVESEKIEPTSEEDFNKNFIRVREVLRESPMLFTRALTNDADDLMALKWLLPQLNKDEQRLIKSSLSVERIRKLKSLTTKSASSGLFSEESANIWLRGFIERLAIFQIEGKGFCEKHLPPELNLKLTFLRPEDLFSAARKVDTPAAWRVAVEYAWSKGIIAGLEKLDITTWKKIIAGSRVSLEEINTAVNRILELFPAKTMFIDMAADQDSYLSTTVLESVLPSLFSGGIHDVDRRMAEIKQISPLLSDLVEQRIWTPGKILQVPQKYLKEVFNSLASLQKAEIIYSLPENVAKYLFDIIPEGNAQIMVSDFVGRLEEQSDASMLQKAEETCREFIDYLRVQAEEGKYSLNVSAAQQRAAGVEEIPAA